MKVTTSKNTVNISLTHDQLGILRYTLFEGMHKLRHTAIGLKSLKSSEAKSAKETADKAEAVNKALEEAVQKWVRSQE